ncbi:MAG: hypothetical protein HYY84_02870 [Deltaproteobacteria bacterium]|nr:hypothetical protein [Deltaproteobacteria bacterium]
MNSTNLTRVFVGVAALVGSSLATESVYAQAPSKALLDCYGVCNRTVPNQQKRNDCFRVCRAGQTPTAPTKTAPAKSGWEFAKPDPATTTPVTQGNLTACYGVCNRTVPDKQKRNACFQACRAGQPTPVGMTEMSPKSKWEFATPAPATITPKASDLTACYGVCNRTVPDRQKRNACFQACRAGQTKILLPGHTPAVGMVQGQGELDKELETSRQTRGACIQSCYDQLNNIDERRRCEDVCYGQHQARSNAAYDRDRARSSVVKAAIGVPAGNCKKGCEALHARYSWEATQRGGEKFPAKATWVPACVARCAPATPVCQEALAILRGAKKFMPGTAGFLGQNRIELWEAKLRGCANPDADTTAVANEIRREWKASLAAPRYRGE